MVGVLERFGQRFVGRECPEEVEVTLSSLVRAI